MCKNNVTHWFSFYWEICVSASFDESEKLGGQGKIVEIDESLFGKTKNKKRVERLGLLWANGYFRGWSLKIKVFFEW